MNAGSILDARFTTYDGARPYHFANAPPYTYG